MTTTNTTTIPSGNGSPKTSIIGSHGWLRGLDLNQRPSGYENRGNSSHIPQSSSIPAVCSVESAALVPVFGTHNNHINNYSGEM